MRKENSGQCRETNEKLCKVKTRRKINLHYETFVLQRSTILPFVPYEYCSSQLMTCFLKNNAGLK